MEDQSTAIAWVELSYKVKKFCFSDEKTILNQLNGSVEFNTINALMGPSGAGKTTLLKCLNGKLINGLDPKSRIFVNSNEKINSCFVGQHSKEHLIICLTAKQNLIYASKLKNSNHKSNTGPIDHQNNVREIMEEFMIEDIAHTQVNRCSGGEQKRLTIAVEMTKIVKPNILCIDEPTSGLDSNVAETVMNCLSKLSKSHRMSIITSIHQPNNEIVVMFDKIYVLTKDGNCLFSGPPKQIESYLSEYNIIMSKNQVPIEQLLKLASIETHDENIEDLIRNTRQTLIQTIFRNTDQMKISPKGLYSGSKSFIFIDMWYIIMRTMTQQYIKQWKALMFQFLWYICIAFFATNVFSEDMGKPDACLEVRLLETNNTCTRHLQINFLLFQNLNFLYFTTLLVLFVHLSQTTLTYLTDLKIFMNEHQNKWYSTGSYFWAKNFVEVMQTVIISMIYAFLVFKLSGQYSEGHRCIQFVVIIALGFLCTESIGHIMGIILINYHQMAVLLSIGLFMTMSLYANFFVLIKDMPLILQYISELSFFKFFFNSILLIIYGQNRCSDGKESSVLYKYGINDSELTNNYLKLAIYAIFLKILSFIVLLIKNNFNVNNKRIKHKTKNPKLIELNANELTVINLNIKQNDLIFNEMLSNEINDNSIEFIENIGETQENEISIAWTHLTLKIPKTLFSDEKVVLKNISGFFKFKTINAIMGCSGSGKTSLLKCINGLYSDYLTDETTIFLNKNLKIKTCFITQEVKDHLLTGLTAGQAMTYASKLKNSNDNFNHKENVENIMEELLIGNTFDTNVEKCSGGEQKRLIIAMELTSVIKPNLICIDEPTSGLDSNAAEVAIKCLKRLSEKHNICVITSIHQPNNDILMLFDKLYVLSKAGQVIYTSRPQHLFKYLLKCNIDCSQTQLPIEVLLKHSCNTNNDKIIQNMVEMTEEFETKAINLFINHVKPVPEGIETVSKRFYLRDLWLLLMRTLTYTFRYYWKLIVFQFFLYIGCGLTFRQFFSEDIGRPSGCFSFDDLSKKCFKSKADLSEEILLSYNMSYNFFILTNLMFLSITVSTIGFTSDLKMFLNEHRNGWYSTGAYYWSKTLIEFLPTIVIIFCYTYVVYIYSSERPMFWEYVVFMIFSALLAQSLGHFIGIIFSSNQRLAMFGAVGIQTLSLFFSGFIIPTKELHYSIEMLSCLSPFKLVIENLLLIQYGFDRCAKREFSMMLFLFNISDDDFYRNSQLLILQFFLFRSVSLIALMIKVNSITKNREQQYERKQEMEKDFEISNPFLQ